MELSNIYKKTHCSLRAVRFFSVISLVKLLDSIGD